MIRPATEADLPEIEAFLAARAASSMFLRGNIARHGLTGGAHRHATVVHVGAVDGAIAAVFGLTTDGMLLLQAPAPGDAFIAEWAAGVRELPLAGVTGDAAQVAVLAAALDLPGGTFTVDHNEPLMELALGDLLPPPPGLTLRPACDADIPLLTGWFAAYLADTGLAPHGDPALAAQAEARARDAVGGPVRLLCRDGSPVAMAAINARAGHDVQVGGVFVPQALRGAGLGRAATATVLAEARAGGARRACLFANNVAACRAYAALGFRTVGQYRILLAGAA
jgi:predicted GNAT family acetyltransferase